VTALRSAIPLLLLLVLCAGRAPGQEVVLADHMGDRAAEEMRRLIERGRYQVLDRDTVLPADFHWPGDLVVFRVAVRLEGRVDGAVAVVQGDFFLRPNGIVGGPVLEIGGGAHLSGLATAGEVITLAPVIRPEVVWDGERIVITLHEPPPPPRVRPGGLAGLRSLTYDRVNALTVAAGGTLRLGGGADGADLDATALYHTARRRFGGQAALVLPLHRNLETVAVVASATVTNDDWIRGPLSNSLGALLLRSDGRDYFHSDRASLTLGRPPGPALIAGEFSFRPRVTVLASQDRSLASADPWSLRGGRGPWRPNPPISEGTLVSATAGATVEWRGLAGRFLGDATIEWAPEGLGDFEFAHAVAAGRWEARALWDHSLVVYARGMGSVDGRPAPLQRWTFVGGGGTIPTLPIAALRGDRLAFVESIYRAPLPFVQVPVIGSPTLRFYHVAGAAWPSGTPAPPLEQSLGVGLEAAVFHATLLIDPAVPRSRPVLDLGTTFARPVVRRLF
jgi:hypothetical protein